MLLSAGTGNVLSSTRVDLKKIKMRKRVVTRDLPSVYHKKKKRQFQHTARFSNEVKWLRRPASRDALLETLLAVVSYLHDFSFSFFSLKLRHPSDKA